MQVIPDICFVLMKAAHTLQPLHAASANQAQAQVIDWQMPCVT